MARPLHLIFAFCSGWRTNTSEKSWCRCLGLDFTIAWDMANHGDVNINLPGNLQQVFFLIVLAGRQCAGGRSTCMRQMSQEYLLVSFHHWMERWGMLMCPTKASSQLSSWPWLALAQWLDGTIKGLTILTIYSWNDFYHWWHRSPHVVKQFWQRSSCQPSARLIFWVQVMVMVDGVAEVPGLELPSLPSRHDFKHDWAPSGGGGGKTA